MAKIGEKTWIAEIRPAVLLKLLNSSPHDPLPTATQTSLGYAFYDMAVSVLALLHDGRNLNKIQTHVPMSTKFLYFCYVFVQKGI